MQNSPLVVSNVTLFQYSEDILSIVLTAANSPAGTLKATWRLPSTQVQRNQTSLTALETSLRSTIGLQDSDISYREQLYTSEYPTPSHSTVCVSYLYISRGTRWFKGSQQVGVFPVNKLPKLSPADRAIIRYALDRLHAKVLHSTVLQFLLPQQFDLTQLQQAFETITHQRVDRRNFRKKILALDILKANKKATNRIESVRYSFKSSTLVLLDKPFPPRKHKK